MNVEDGIKLQAYLDGELTGREARRMATLLESDPAAQALHAELQQTNSMLAANQPEFRLPESREFYWSKIEREISQDKTAHASGIPRWAYFLRRHLAAFGGTAVAASLMLFLALQMNFMSGELFEEIDNPLDGTSSFSFRSESQQMTLVWISANSSGSATEVSDAPMPMPMPMTLPDDLLL